MRKINLTGTSKILLGLKIKIKNDSSKKQKIKINLKKS